MQLLGLEYNQAMAEVSRNEVKPKAHSNKPVSAHVEGSRATWVSSTTSSPSTREAPPRCPRAFDRRCIRGDTTHRFTRGVDSLPPRVGNQRLSCARRDRQVQLSARRPHSTR